MAGRVSRSGSGREGTVKLLLDEVAQDLIESGLEAREEERKRFFALADRLTETNDPLEQKKLKRELAEMTFGD